MSRHVGFLLIAWLVLLVPSPRAAAGEPRFRPHVIDAEATNSACAALDINQDGRLDVIAGTWWYAAPEWKRHFVRDVEVIRGRFDDYSNLPLDVNGDGWTDFVSANYRSSKLYWIENPGPERAQAVVERPAEPGAGSAWPVHLIEQPGPMETARLADIDGDGRLDILPNGVRFAAWWELVGNADTGPAAEKFRWVRHSLPAELAGHGVGFGDIDGDGRGDVVGPTGWAQQPADARLDRWTFHPEFRLHRDAGIPILVEDVDGDGDNDIVWTRGHNSGIYWLEQVRSRPAESDAGRRWIPHAIDTSWSQAHAPLWGDIDNDGQPELIAGKRYMGHDGNDLGEYDPLMICAYKFDRGQRTWRRQVLCESWRIGFGLDPRLVDLDGDGDLDLVCPGRSGLYWLENLLAGEGPAGESLPLRVAGAAYDSHTDLSVFRDARGELRPVTSPAEWAIRRAHVLASVAEVTGPLPGPARRVPLDVQVVAEQDTEHYVRRKITFAVEPGDRVPAWLLVPHKLERPAPALLCLHQTTSIGKDEPAGLGGQPSLHYAHELAQLGYVCLAPDHPGFGEYAFEPGGRRAAEGDGEAGGAKGTDGARSARGTYDSGMIKAVWNNVRAIDVLESLPEVDRDKIGCIGHSLGAHTGLFTAVFDQRLRLVVSSCGFTAFADDDIASWSGPRYMPRIATAYGNDAAKLPFDFHEVVAALAPRPVFVNAPLRDADFAVAGVRKVLASASGVYELWKTGGKLTAVFPDSEHDFPDVARQRCYQWIEAQWK
jgi:dienelactone hydrolase